MWPLFSIVSVVLKFNKSHTRFPAASSSSLFLYFTSEFLLLAQLFKQALGLKLMLMSVA